MTVPLRDALLEDSKISRPPPPNGYAIHLHLERTLEAISYPSRGGDFSPREESGQTAFLGLQIPFVETVC